MKAVLLTVVGFALLGASPVAPSLLSDADIDPQQILPPPPTENSAGHRAEVAELAAIEASRSPSDIAAAKDDDATKNASVFAEAIGPGFDLDRLPETARLMTMVRSAEKFAADRAKLAFKRPRPWISDPKIQACSRDDDPLSSYPSGHTTMGYSMGSILARLIPGRAPQVMARAQRYGESRIVCEVHFRSDVTAGETLGVVVAERLMGKPEFRAQFGRAQMELKAANLTG